MFELRHLSDRRLHALQSIERVLPHVGQPRSSETQHCVKQRSTLKAKRPRTGAQGAQEYEAAKPLVLPTKQPAAGAQRQLGRFIILNGLDRMVEKGVADEVILRLVVAADEDDGQSPALLRSIAVGRAAGPLIRKIALDVVPPAKMTMEAELGLLRKIRQNRLYADLDGILLIVEIAAAMKVVLVDHGPSIEPLRSQHKVESLANRRFADVVSADQKCVSRQVDDATGNTAETRDRQTLYFHLRRPPAGPF